MTPVSGAATFPRCVIQRWAWSTKLGKAERATAAAATTTVARARPSDGIEFTSERPEVYVFVMLAAIPWTTIASVRPRRSGVDEVSSRTDTNTLALQATVLDITPSALLLQITA